MCQEDNVPFSRETAQRLWREHRERAEKAEPGESIDFSGMPFPEDPDGKYFHGVCFTTPVDFSDARFESNRVFEKAKFCCEAIFRNASFPLGCLFTECVFEDDVSFESAKFEQHAYLAARFESKADFTGVTFLADVVFGDDFGSAIFQADAIFSDAIFEDAAEYALRVVRHVRGRQLRSSDRFCSWDHALYQRLDYSPVDGNGSPRSSEVTAGRGRGTKEDHSVDQVSYSRHLRRAIIRCKYLPGSDPHDPGRTQGCSRTRFRIYVHDGYHPDCGNGFHNVAGGTDY